MRTGRYRSNFRNFGYGCVPGTGRKIIFGYRWKFSTRTQNSIRKELAFLKIHFYIKYEKLFELHKITLLENFFSNFQIKKRLKFKERHSNKFTRVIFILDPDYDLRNDNIFFKFCPLAPIRSK